MQKLQLIFTLLFVVGWLSGEAAAWFGNRDSAAAKSAGNEETNGLVSEAEIDKRQLVPLPRIGRSAMYAKRQSIIPAPRIGRRSNADLTAQQTKAKIDCGANPDLCENLGSSGGSAASNSISGRTIEELIDPIDIQHRAAFIPRLGKRRSPSAAYNEDGSERVSSNSYQIGSNGNNKNGYRKLILIPGIGYLDVAPDESVDAESLNADTIDNINNNNNNNNDENNNNSERENENLILQQQQQQQRNNAMLIRALLHQQQQQQQQRIAENAKRTIPYTPRIGRAVFAPRIGKKATFVPRIG